MKFTSLHSSLKVLSEYVIIFENIILINIFIIAQRKSDADIPVFLFSIFLFLLNLITFPILLKKGQLHYQMQLVIQLISIN